MNSQMGLFSSPSTDPLALKMRPQKLSDYVGQDRVVQEIQSFGSEIPHLVLWGPPGTGKTTLAHILAREIQGEIFSFNAVLSGVPELRKLITEIEHFRESSTKKPVLFIDEIHRFNKSQQDALLPYLERGEFLFIGATTEYPQTSLNRALLSRLRILELKGHSEEGLVNILTKACNELGREDLKAFIDEIARWSNGDARGALNTLSLLSSQKPEVLQDAEKLKTLLQKQRAFDKNQDRHYDVISAFIKSIRGSDPDAALLWLAVMLDGGEDPIFIARRLMILASEDVGLANSQALQVACNAHYVCQQIGMPEARITLSHATTFIALSPKSNSVYDAINSALNFVSENPTLPVPGHLSSVGPEKKNYKYPHAYPMHYVPQIYRPNEASLLQFYKAGTLGSEGALNEIWKKFTTLLLLLFIPFTLSMKKVDFTFEESTKDEIQDDFLSFAVDLSQVMGRSWWSPEGKVEGAIGNYQVPRLKWKSPQLVKLMQPFKGSMIRLGGSLADSLTYTDDELSILDEAKNFSRDNHFKLLFTANAFSSQAQKRIVEWDKDHSTQFNFWELGNEPNAFALIHGLEGLKVGYRYNKDWLAFKNKISSPLAGPASAFWPVWTEPLSFLWQGTESFIKETVPQIITWHYYPQQSRRCGLALRPAKLEKLLDPEMLDEILKPLKRIQEWKSQYAPKAQIWLGETGHAQCGGEPGVSDRWASSLWWMDQLNLMAVKDVKVVIRQSLHGAHYGLVSEDLSSIRPDYWTSLVWKETIQGKPLEMKTSDPLIRAYGYLKGKTYTFVFINLSQIETEMIPTPNVQEFETWLVSAQQLDSSEIKINNQTMPALSHQAEKIPSGIKTKLLVLKPYSIMFAKTAM